MKAVWNGAVVAESDDIVMVEGNAYFPAAALRMEHVRPSAHQSVCPWKGTAQYHTLVVDGAVNENAAWYYPDPAPAAESIRGRVAFWKGVAIS